jgi:RecB family exonuclease
MVPCRQGAGIRPTRPLQWSVDMSTLAQTGLTLLLGPANSGKLGLVLEWWRERLAQKPVLVTPTGPDARELTAEMAHRAGALIDQVPATTFDGLVRLLLGRSPRYASALEQEVVVSRVLAATSTDALGEAASLPGAAEALKVLLQQLGESGRSPGEIDRILERWAASDRQTAALAGDVRRLVSAYRDVCRASGLEDRPTAVREAIGALEARAGGVTPVAFYGFTSFTPGQRALVEQLSRRTEVLVSFTYDGTRDVNLSTPAEIAWWRSRATDVREVTTQTRAYDSPAIAYLERYFMSDEPRSAPPPAYGGAQGVRFMKASGRRAEAELAAEQIAELLRAGVQAHEIAVVVRSTSSWSRLLARVFDSCGIAFHLDDRRLLGQTGLGHAFLNVLRGVCLDDAAALLAYLRSPYSGLSLETVGDVDLLYRRSPAKGAGVLASLVGGTDREGIAALWDVCGEPGRVDPQAARRLARCMLVAAAGGACPADFDLEEDARAYRALDGALAALSGLDLMFGGEQGALAPRAVLGCVASAAVGTAGGGASGAVQVLSVQRARARRFPVVFVLGLVEGEFPGRTVRPSLLNPAQRARLDQVGGGLFAQEADEEAALFVSALSRASRLLYLGTRDAEDDGSEATPSHLWIWAKDLLEVGETDHLKRTLGDQVFSARSAPTRRHYDRACAAAGLTTIEGGDTRAIPTWECAPVALRDPEVLAEINSTKRYSPSDLESYAQCPFSWFIQRVVRAGELEVELDGKRIGTLLHKLLSATYQELRSRGLLPLRADRVQQAEEVAAREIRQLVDGADCPGTAAERRVAAWRLRRMAGNLFDMEVSTGWSLVPHEFEAWVGGRHGADVGGFKLFGRVDRVDVTRDVKGLFVIDYKTGSIPSVNGIGSEEGLQLPLYLMGIAVDRPACSVLGGAYLSLTDKKRSGIAVEGSEDLLGEAVRGCRVLDQTAMEELLQKTCDISRQTIEGMRAGVIAPRNDRACPPWCLLAPACRVRKRGYRL